MRARSRAVLWASVVALTMVLGPVVGGIGAPGATELSAGFVLPSSAASTATSPASSPNDLGTPPAAAPTGTVTPTVASAAPLTSSALATEIQELRNRGASPSTLSMVQRIAAGVRSGAIPPRSLLLPNINELLGLAVSASTTPDRQYTESPAPMGIADFGTGAKTYEYNTSEILGTVHLTSYNATSGPLYEPSGQYYWNGNPANETGNPYTSGIQLNTVVANVTFPGSSSDPLGSGVFWTQNVPTFSGNSLQFVDNVWNLSALGSTLNPGTLYSYNGTLVPYAFYYDVGPTLPVVYPLSLQLYNNASIVDGRSAISYGYRLADGNGHVYAGIYDTVVFNSPSPPTIQPQFRVDGYALSPYDSVASFDAELVFCGPSDGSNAVVTNLSGSMTLQYLPTGSSAWTSVPSAYDYGTNTGETAIGVAAYWSGTTVYLNQGPSLLYGLWHTPANVGVPSGAIHFRSHSDPNYAFTFLGETVGGSPALQEWAPSDSAGVVNTYLPPSIPGSSAYSVAAYADEYADFTGPSFTASVPHYEVSMTSAPGTLDAPLYMNGEAQARALARAVDGSAAVPFKFQNLVVHVGLPFNLLNDWEFPTFSLFFATGVTSPIVVDHVSQGPNSLTRTLYYYPSPGFVANFTGADCPGGYCYLNFPNLTQEFVDYGGVGDTFTNLDLPGVADVSGLPMGGAISLWGTRDVTVTHVTATNGTFGVWSSAASDTVVRDSTATTGANAFTIAASTGAVGQDLRADGQYSIAVFDMGGSAGTFSHVSASEVSTGFWGVSDQGTTVNQVQAQSVSTGAVDVAGSGLTVSSVRASGGSLGLIAIDAHGLAISSVAATGHSTGVSLGDSTASVSEVSASYGSTGVYVTDASGKVDVFRVGAWSHSVAVNVSGSSGVHISQIFAGDRSTGVYLNDSSKITVSRVFAWDYSIGVVLDHTTKVILSHIEARDHSIRVRGK